MLVGFSTHSSRCGRGPISKESISRRPRVGPRWSDPVQADILRAESACPPAVGGALGGPAPAAHAARKTRAPGKRDPLGLPWSERWFLRESAFLPRVGEALGGSSTPRSRCGTSPLLLLPPPICQPHISPPVRFPYGGGAYDSRTGGGVPFSVRFPSPAVPEGPIRFPTSRPRVPLARKILRIFRFVWSAPQHASRLSKLFNLGCTVL